MQHTYIITARHRQTSYIAKGLANTKNFEQLTTKQWPEG